MRETKSPDDMRICHSACPDQSQGIDNNVQQQNLPPKVHFSGSAAGPASNAKDSIPVYLFSKQDSLIRKT